MSRGFKVKELEKQIQETSLFVLDNNPNKFISNSEEKSYFCPQMTSEIGIARMNIVSSNHLILHCVEYSICYDRNCTPRAQPSTDYGNVVDSCSSVG